MGNKREKTCPYCNEKGETVGVEPILVEQYKDVRRCKNENCDNYNELYSIK